MARRPLRTLRSAHCAAILALLFVATTVLPTASPQLGPLDCLNCDFELVNLEWEGAARPGSLTLGRFEIRNTGESTDRYRIDVNARNTTWVVEADPAETPDVPPGAGLLAQDDNNVTFAVRVLVPPDARANDRTTVTITVTSQNAEDLERTQDVEARALQTYGWTLECTPQLDAPKTKRSEVLLTATNTGNGRDRAEVTYTPIDGIVVTDPQSYDLEAGASRTQTIEVGVGLRADDGDYDIRWDLRSTAQPDTRASCTTTFQVTGGGPDTTPPGDGEDEESPAPGAMLMLVVAALAGLARARPRSQR